MNQNINQKLNEILQSLDPAKQKAAKESVERLLHTPEGQRLAADLKNKNTEGLAKLFMSMNTNDIKEKLKSTDTNTLSSVSLEEMLKKLR